MSESTGLHVLKERAELLVAFSLNLVKAREKKSLSRKQLAKRIGTTISHIHHLETGKNLPFLDLLTIICEVLDVTPEELIGNDRLN